MKAQEIRQRYLAYFEAQGHVPIPRASLVPVDDPTTLLTGSGMQPLLPYLLGADHPAGQRLVNSQPCLRVQDIDEVGDNRHTTGFEMLGNWSLGDYFKAEQLPWFFNFLVDELGLAADKLYVTCFRGSAADKLPADEVSGQLFVDLYRQRGIEAQIVDLGSAAKAQQTGMGGGRIFYYDDAENWWSRGGAIAQTPVGDPAGGDCEFFYDFGEEYHDTARYGQPHPASDSGRFLEVGNAVFMEYQRQATGFKPLSQQNVDFGGGLERLAAATDNNPDVFMTSLLAPIVRQLEELAGVAYADYQSDLRIIADHFRAAGWLAVDGVVPANKERGYILRRLIRRALRIGLRLGLDSSLSPALVPTISQLYVDDYPEWSDVDQLVAILSQEEEVFRQTLSGGVRMFAKLARAGQLDGAGLFKLYDTFGFPAELSLEEAAQLGCRVTPNARAEFAQLMAEQRQRSRTAAGQFKGGLADHQPMTVKHHTATHLMYRALRNVLGEGVMQRGSNVTADRLRFDFSFPTKLTADQLMAVESMVNNQIEKDWPVNWRLEDTEAALADGVLGAFGDRYGDQIRVYTVGDPDGEHYSREICGGPHVDQTSELAHDDRVFKILKEESSSAGVRRIRAALVAADV